MAWDNTEQVKAALENIGMVEYFRDHQIPASVGEALQDGNWEVILHQFAAGEFSTENLDFLRAVAVFEKSGDLVQAEEIYNRFVATSAPTEVNLPASIRGPLDGMFGKNGTGHGPPNLFDSAKTEITRMTQADTYQRFKTKAKAAQDELGASIDWENVETREHS